MKILVQREPSERETTFGKMDVDGVRKFDTLEDEVREDPKPETPENEAKVYGKTAIPAGDYEVLLTHSPKFSHRAFYCDLADGRVPQICGLERDLLHGNDGVAGFDGVRIHPATTVDDLLGCIGIGKTRGSFGVRPAIFRSREGYEEFIGLMLAAEERKERVFLSIRDAAKAS
jgi:hypothetical protein